MASASSDTTPRSNSKVLLQTTRQRVASTYLEFVNSE